MYVTHLTLISRVLPVALLTCISVSCGGTQSQVESVPRAPSVSVARTRVFEADAVVVQVGEIAGSEDALVRVLGTGGEIDGLVIRSHHERRPDGERFHADWHGVDRSALYAFHRHGKLAWKIHVPGERDGRIATERDSVDPGLGTELARLHDEQTESGVLRAFQAFDRDREKDQNLESLASDLERTRRECEAPSLAASIDWTSVGDGVLLEYNVASYCDNVLAELRYTCGKPGGSAVVRDRIGSVRCSFATVEEPSLRLEEGALTVAFSPKTVNLQDKIRTHLHALPDAEHGTFGQALRYASTVVCLDEKAEHTVVLAPGDGEEGGLAYGSGEQLYRVPSQPSLSEGWFFDPRQFNPQNNASFRGYDLRYFSHVDVDREAPSCTVVCGERSIPLRIADEDEKQAILAAAEYLPSPMTREPHALVRDDKGVYYYVDRGNTRETAKDFHLYRGRRGAMKRLQMVDVVSDSEGEVFESRGGALRLLIEKDDAQWISGRRVKPLKRLPIRENLDVIYNQLGVYLGEELGVPCDDL